MKAPALRQAVAEPADERFEIAPHDRREVAVHHRGRDPLELPPLRRNAVRQPDGEAGQASGEIRRRRQLMRRVLEGEQEGDGDRLKTPFLHGVHEAVEVAGVERCHDLARRRDPLPRREGVLQGGERLRLVPADREDLAAVVALDRVDVAEVLGGEQRDLGTPPGEQGVQPDRRAVDEEVDRRIGRNGRFDAMQHGQGRIVRRGEDFRRAAGAGGAILVDDIGEGAADIGGHPVVSGQPDASPPQIGRRGPGAPADVVRYCSHSPLKSGFASRTALSIMACRGPETSMLMALVTGLPSMALAICSMASAPMVFGK